DFSTCAFLDALYRMREANSGECRLFQYLLIDSRAGRLYLHSGEV
ncbi:hypothetical protein A2U01_0031543, partial [Trifolium medium]|nr:hypothetical protein [Trifolium medium]